jgi:hypothetical protein
MVHETRQPEAQRPFTPPAGHAPGFSDREVSDNGSPSLEPDFPGGPPHSDPDEAVARSLRALVRAELNQPAVAKPRANQTPSVKQFLTLTLLGADATLFLYMVNGQLRLNDNPLVDMTLKVIPAIGGAVFVSYLEIIRTKLIALSSRPLTSVVGLVGGVLLILATVWPMPLNVSLEPSAEVTLDGAAVGPLNPNDPVQRLSVRGLGTHNIIVRQNYLNELPLIDTIEVGAVDVFRSLTSNAVIGSPRRVSAYHLATTRFLIVTGAFPDSYLRRVRRYAWVDDEEPEHVSVWLPLRGEGFTPVPIPLGQFTFRLEPPMCARARITGTVTNSMLRLPYDAKCADQRLKPSVGRH